MSLSGPTPLQSFLGGIGLALPVQARLSFNHSTLGISGFIRGAGRGNIEDILSVLGMISSGFVIAAIEGGKPIVQNLPTPHMAFAGLLVGVGTAVCVPICSP